MDTKAQDSDYQQAFDLLQPRMNQIPEKDLTRPTVRLGNTALAVLALIDTWNKGGWRNRFETFSATGYWDFDNYETLPLAARALWHVQYKLREKRVLATEANLPEDVASRGIDLRARMRHVCEFLFRGSPSLSSKLAYLRGGTGYVDLAHDLLGYAELYRDNLALVRTAPIHFRDDDMEQAVKLAHTILALLTVKEPREAAQWVNYQSRAFTLLRNCYDQVRAAGLFLGRDEPAIDKVFPSLYTLAKKSKSKKQSPAPEPEPPDPSEPSDPSKLPALSEPI